MTNIINFKDYKQSSRPKKRMIDADGAIEWLQEFKHSRQLAQIEIDVIEGLITFIDVCGDTPEAFK